MRLDIKVDFEPKPFIDKGSQQGGFMMLRSNLSPCILFFIPELVRASLVELPALAVQTSLSSALLTHPALLVRPLHLELSAYNN